MQKVTPRRARAQNTQIVLKTIYANGPISRAEISRVTDLTPPTVSDVVSELITNGLVEEVGHAPSSSGRRAILLQVVDDSRQLIGIDLSRRDFRGALANLRGQIKYRVDLPLQGRDGDAALALVYDLADILVETASSPLLGIGVGAPGLVDASKGVLQQSVNLNWRYIPLGNLLQKRYNLPVYMANDCQVAALAVYTFGAHADNELPLVVINVGWGVGAGIIIHGKLLHGTPVGAGEVGHVTVVENGALCACGNYGCLETIASSRGVIRRVKELIDCNPRSFANKSVAGSDPIDMDMVIELLEAGNEDVRQVVLETGQALGSVAANLVGVLGSCRILLSGEVTRLGQLLIETMREEMDRRTLPSLSRVSEIGKANMGSDIVIRGSSALILHHELGVL
ncbi:MAG: ROK family transcriptional regulator [Anaerolineales bacterium]|jgi:N-acetylglucosamine repressor